MRHIDEREIPSSCLPNQSVANIDQFLDEFPRYGHASLESPQC